MLDRVRQVVEPGCGTFWPRQEGGGLTPLGWQAGPLPWAQGTTGLRPEAADSLGFAERDCGRRCHPQ